MKQLINNIINWRTLMGTLIILNSLFVQSCKDDEQMKWVDLRYKANDSYTIAASGEEAVNIQVKSTDPWIVYSNHSDWCTISPNEGGPNDLYDVKITYNANNNLDDRTDTITIKSDYWIGKEVAVIQKGIAYLKLENAENLTLEKEESTGRFNVKSNQDWTATVTEGEAWLSIEDGKSGKLDGTITLKVLENKGEQRSGTVTVYNRHGEVAATVICTQKGVVLLPESQSLRALYNDSQITLNVESNGEWVVEKEDKDAEWYSFETTEYSGNGTIVIKLNENTGTSVLKTTFRISSKAEEGTEPVTKTITLKQGNHAIPVHYTFDNPSDWEVNGGTVTFDNGEMTCNAGRVTRDGFLPGYYSFHIKSMTKDSQSTLFFTYNGDTSEVRWHLNMSTGKTNYSTMPWTPVIDKNKAFDTTKGSYTLGLNITKSTQDGLAKIEWYLDGELRETYDNNEAAKIPYGNALIFLGSSAGTVVYDYYEYTAPIEWGDE